MDRNANKYIQREVDHESATQGTKKIGTREKTVFILCLVTGTVNKSWKKHLRVGPNES